LTVDAPQRDAANKTNTTRTAAETRCLGRL